MNIVLKREAKQFLERVRDEIHYLLIDGSLDKPPSGPCGCCGPPPSPDYKVQVIANHDKPSSPSTKNLIETKKIVPIKIDAQLHEAITTAKMSIVIFFVQETGSEATEGNLIAKII
ncbi:MAG: hypothetical protein ACFFCS_15010 [Candidatus Hodarchaeota archaeon]